MFLSETAPTKYPRSPLPHPQQGWGTGRTVRSPEPTASARSPEASSLSPGLVFYRSRSLDFKEILFSFFSSSQTHHKYILVRGESYRSLPLCGSEVAGGQLQCCQEQRGSAGLHWAASSQQRFSLAGKGDFLSPGAVSKRSPGLWSVGTLKPGKRSSLCSRDISGSSSCSVQCSRHCRAFPQLPRCARLGVTSAAGGAGRVSHTCCSLWAGSGVCAAGSEDVLVPPRTSWGWAVLHMLPRSLWLWGDQMDSRKRWRYLGSPPGAVTAAGEVVLQ